MKYFSVPSDFKKETIDKYDAFNEKFIGNRIIETYGQLSHSDLGSGRAGDHIPIVSKKNMAKYIDYSLKKKVKFNYTLNSTCLSNQEFSNRGASHLLKFLEELYEMGIDTMTVALPSLMELVKTSKYPIKIKASTVCHITNADKALSYKKLGVDRIVVDESANRDFGALKSIRNMFGDKVELIVNVICYKNCIYRMFHHNQMSHDISSNEKSVTYYSHRCMMKRCEKPSNLLRMNFIRPEDLQHYVGIGIRYFKLQGRQAVQNGDIVESVKRYILEDYKGNLLELLNCFSQTNAFNVYLDNKKLKDFLLPFVKKIGFCTNDCNTCKYCEDFIKQCVDIDDTKRIHEAAQIFYENFDQYTANIKKLSKEIGDKSG